MKLFTAKTTGPFEASDAHITKRELQVITELCHDCSAKMIAERLELSEFTVNDHIKNAKRKLSVHTVNGLIAKCFREKIIE